MDDRRGALKVLLAVGTTSLCAAATAPLGIVVAVPHSGGGAKERWIRAAALADLKVGEPRRVTMVADVRDAWTAQKDVTLGAVWLIREADDTVRCLSATCPHLGCSVSSTETGFFCACHDSDFGARGERRNGPSPRDLDALTARVVSGFVEVDFRRFRVGLANRVEIG